jgi:hypothetical protein
MQALVGRETGRPTALRFAAFNDNDIVWVYGYPLMLVPLLLSRKLQRTHGTPVIFSCEIPWPSSEARRPIDSFNTMVYCRAPRQGLLRRL